MAKPNYSFEKRQRELAKKKKKEEKLRDKTDRKTGTEEADGPAGELGVTQAVVQREGGSSAL